MKSSYEKFYGDEFNIENVDFCIVGMMRSGSNYFQELLNTSREVKCYSEIFNPNLMPVSSPVNISDFYEQNKQLSQEKLSAFLREFDKDAAQKKWGFRIFNNHYDKVLYSLVAAKNIKVIFLKRNLLSAYCSLKIAQKTNQWRLTNETYRIGSDVKLRVDFNEFVKFACEQALFYNGALMERVRSGGSLLVVDYDDLAYKDKLDQSMRDIAEYLQLKGTFDVSKVRTLKQNLRTVKETVDNYDELLKNAQNSKIARWFF